MIQQLAVVVALLTALATGSTPPSHYEPLPLCPADILCTNCKGNGGGDWYWDDEEGCVRDACGVCGGDGSSCQTTENNGEAENDDDSGCDKDCQTILITVGAAVLVLLLCLFLWFVLSGPAKTFLVPATAVPTAPRTTSRRMTVRRPRTYYVGHVRRRRGTMYYQQ